VTAALLLLALAQPAPDEAVRVETMRAQMHEYFGGEWREAYAWLGAGVPTLAGGAVALARGGRAWQGAAFPLMLFGLVQSVAGIFLFGRTPGQVRTLDAQLGRDPQTYAREERARMARVNRGFSWYRPVELLLLAAGAGVAGFGDARGDFRLGLGLGLMAESAVMLLFDHFAGARAERYHERLAAFAR
jgi:hypothetical protein